MTSHYNELPTESVDDTVASHLTTEGSDRRDMLARLGRFAYAAPALALLSQPKGAQADYGRGGSKGRRRSGKGRRRSAKD